MGSMGFLNASNVTAQDIIDVDELLTEMKKNHEKEQGLSDSIFEILGGEVEQENSKTQATTYPKTSINICLKQVMRD